MISRRVQFLKKDDEGFGAGTSAGVVRERGRRRGSWAGIRPLTGVVSFPVVRQNGTILTDAGYDFAPDCSCIGPGPCWPFQNVRPSTTRQSQQAIARNNGGFPFASDMQVRVARRAFDAVGPPRVRTDPPLFLVDANVRAAGKLEPGSHLLHRHRQPFLVISYPSILKMAKRTAKEDHTSCSTVTGSLFDNLTGAFGDGTLDALTGTEWQDRILGGNRQFGPLTVTFYAPATTSPSEPILPAGLPHPPESPYERPESGPT